jgi:hypothetical protein
MMGASAPSLCREWLAGSWASWVVYPARGKGVLPQAELVVNWEGLRNQRQHQPVPMSTHVQRLQRFSHSLSRMLSGRAILFGWMIACGFLTAIAFGKTCKAVNAEQDSDGKENAGLVDKSLRATGAAGPLPCPAGGGNGELAELMDLVWSRVVEQRCLTCHRQGADAEDSGMIFVDLLQSIGPAREDGVRRNLATLKHWASVIEDGRPKLLLKARGDLDHGGGEILAGDSRDYAVLADCIERLQMASEVTWSADAFDDQPSIWEGVPLLSDRDVLRRATLSLAGRLPTAVEQAAVDERGRTALVEILDDVMREDAFYDRLREGFNDIFLITAVDDNAEVTALSYEHFENTRLWYQGVDFGHLEDERDRERAGYKLAGDYREAILQEPMRLIEYIVRNDRPFTEIVTADYTLMSPYTARGYGLFDQLKAEFSNTDDPFEYIPARLPALRGRSSSEDQDSANGLYPHAGLLSNFLYLARYPTTETNRNRLRARMYYQHFLGVDVLELAARVGDAAAVNAQYEIPTMQAADCVVCHRTLDPVAGLFQDYWRFDPNFALYGKRKEGWFSDMFGPGLEGVGLPDEERWRGLQWLGERTAADPRFSVAMVEHVYYILMGRHVLKPPTDMDDPMYLAKRRGYRALRRQTEAIATRFAEQNYQLKQVFRDWILSDFYRAGGVAAAADDPCRQAELEDVAIMRLLSPEQLERKIAAVFGERWNRLQEEMAMLYGGIDLKEVTERAADPSGAMGAIQRIMSNDVACHHVARDFAKPAAERLLFPTIEPEVVPGSAKADLAIRQTAAHLHSRILGLDQTSDDPDVLRTAGLFQRVVEEARSHNHLDRAEVWSCRQGEAVVDDPLYTVRGWRAVVTYLLRRQEFLYE